MQFNIFQHAVLPALTAQSCADTAGFSHNRLTGAPTEDFCGWMRQNTEARPQRYCDSDIDVFLACPQTCSTVTPNSCPCGDDPDFEFVGVVTGKNYNCEWITKSSNPENTLYRYQTYCVDGDISIKIGCADTCGTCDLRGDITLSPTTSPVPPPPTTNSPTKSPTIPPTPLPTTKSPSKQPTMSPNRAPTQTPSR